MWYYRAHSNVGRPRRDANNPWEPLASNREYVGMEGLINMEAAVAEYGCCVYKGGRNERLKGTGAL